VRRSQWSLRKVSLFGALTGLLLLTSVALRVGEVAAAPGDTGPIQGSATAKQDPPGSCAGRPDTITFSATVSIGNGVLRITDPGGDASGPINYTGTPPPHLASPQGETYDVLSNIGTTLNLRELNGGCNFLTTITLQQPLPALIGGAAQQATPANQSTASAPVPAVTVSTGGGNSLTWLWVAGSVAGFVLVVGSVALVVINRPGSVTVIDPGGTSVPTGGISTVPDCSEKRQRAETVVGFVRGFLDEHAELSALVLQIPFLDAVATEADARYKKSVDAKSGWFDPELLHEKEDAKIALEDAQKREKELQGKPGMDQYAFIDLVYAVDELSVCLGMAPLEGPFLLKFDLDRVIDRARDLGLYSPPPAGPVDTLVTQPDLPGPGQGGGTGSSGTSGVM
jgi:hypothetical protein